MISKTLFIEVVAKAKELISREGYEFEEFYFDKKSNTARATISKITSHVNGYPCGTHCPVNINVYELEHLCKRWALGKGYMVITHSYSDTSFASYTFSNSKMFEAPSEYDAVVLLCEWILEQC